jgi:hypothetical protein
MRKVLGQAMRNRRFLVMSGAYFVCGLNLVFLSTHLPAYLAICGQDPMLSAEALAVIGGMSCIGSLLSGWLGGIYGLAQGTGALGKKHLAMFADQNLVILANRNSRNHAFEAGRISEPEGAC